MMAMKILMATCIQKYKNISLYILQKKKICSKPQLSFKFYNNSLVKGSILYNYQYQSYLFSLLFFTHTSQECSNTPKMKQAEKSDSSSSYQSVICNGTALTHTPRDWTISVLSHIWHDSSVFPFYLQHYENVIVIWPASKLLAFQ